MKQQLNEGLRPLDLNEMVSPLLEVDTFRSKMGEDQDICVISFTVKDRDPAIDLMEFIEKGYNFVLDADVSAGENAKGEYAVFVELSRSAKLAEQIREITYGVKKLTGLEEFKFRYHKKNQIYDVTEDALRKIIPPSAKEYQNEMKRIKTESVKSFFSRTIMDDLTLEGDVITIHKPFDKKIQLKWLTENDPRPVVEGATDIDSDATAEIFWLTKVLGDYDISKFGDRFLFTNGNRAMLLQRTDL